MTGNVHVDAAHRGRRRDVVIDDDGGHAALAAWAKAAKSGGAQVWVQLNHAGRQTPRFINARPHAPSAVAGVADHRGEVVPILDLRVRFGLPRLSDPRRAKWILIEVENRTFGLAVDRVADAGASLDAMGRNGEALGHGR